MTATLHRLPQGRPVSTAGDRWAALHAVEPAHRGPRQVGTADVVRLRSITR